ncbi:MAG TPA: PQQ-binding-like beta-propeller repeat protein [Niastella sp.]
MNLFRPLMPLGSIVCFSVLLSTWTSCDKNKDEDVPPPVILRDSSKLITYFSITKAGDVALDLKEVGVEIKSDSILVAVPAGTDLTNMTPSITFKGVILTPSGTVAQNFSQPVTYTVMAEDSTTRKYVVVVKKRPIRNMVFVGGGGNNKSFYALNAVTGAKVWEYTGTKGFDYSCAAFKDSIVYVGGLDNYVYAFHALTGQVLWKVLTGSTGIEAPVTVDGNTVYVGCNDDIFYALDAQTGKEKWRYNTFSNISTGAVVVNGTVYFGCSDSRVYALNAESGKLKWFYAAFDMINASGPAVVNGVVYFGSRDKYLYAIDANTGAHLWWYNCGVSLEMSSPTVVNGVVYIGGWYDVSNFNKAGSLFAINATTGALVWEKLPNTGFSSSPVVSNGMLYISADGGNFNAINTTTGDVAWSKRILPNGADPTVADGVVFVGGGGNFGFFRAYDAATGAEKWKFDTTNTALTFSGPLVLDSLGNAHYPGASGMQQ